MIRFSRRTFFHRTSIGAAAVGTLVAAPQLLARAARPVEAAAQPRAASVITPEQQAALASGGPVVAYVRDRSRGEIAIFVGTQEIIRHDPELVSRLLQIDA